MFLGTTTAVGGGIVRDVLAGEVPVIFRADSALYAIPAACGAVATVVCSELDVYDSFAPAAIAASVLIVRLVAMRFGWRAPSVRLVRMH